MHMRVKKQQTMHASRISALRAGRARIFSGVDRFSSSNIVVPFFTNAVFSLSWPLSKDNEWTRVQTHKANMTNICKLKSRNKERNWDARARPYLRVQSVIVKRSLCFRVKGSTFLRIIHTMRVCVVFTPTLKLFVPMMRSLTALLTVLSHSRVVCVMPLALRICSGKTAYSIRARPLNCLRGILLQMDFN